LIDRGGFDRIDANLQKEVYLTSNAQTGTTWWNWTVFEGRKQRGET
jgi:hypothetical protein